MKLLLLALCASGLAGCTSVTTQIEINAPADKVRAAVVDYKSYPTWNPFVLRIVGDMTEGNDVRVTVKPVGQPEITGTGHVVATEENRIAWSGRLGLPGVFSGVHTFLIEPEGPNKTLFINKESMRGLSVLFYDFKPAGDGFAAMNVALKERVEKQ